MNWQWRLAQYTEIRWWQSYLKNKEVDTYLVRKRQYWKTLLKKLELTIDPSLAILDAGCGPAGIFTILAGDPIVALDPLIQEYETKLEHFSQEQYPNVEFVSLHLEAFQTEEQFDWVFCLNAINHVAKLEKAITQLVHATKPGGRIFLTIDVHKYHFLKYIFRLIPLDILHPHQYLGQEYSDIFRKLGCQINRELVLKPGWVFDYQFIEIVKK